MHFEPNTMIQTPSKQAGFTTVVPKRVRVLGAWTLLSRMLRLKDFSGPATQVKKKKLHGKFVMAWQLNSVFESSCESS